jgi:hypothetical protein
MGISFLETSAKNAINIESAFMEVTSKLIAARYVTPHSIYRTSTFKIMYMIYVTIF